MMDTLEMEWGVSQFLGKPDVKLSILCLPLRYSFISHFDPTPTKALPKKKGAQRRIEMP